jgi:hypothetical protein
MLMTLRAGLQGLEHQLNLRTFLIGGMVCFPCCG